MTLRLSVVYCIVKSSTTKFIVVPVTCGTLHCGLFWSILSKNSETFNAISNKASAENRNALLKSYDYLLNSKYKVIVNKKTLDRVKNYFRWY